MNSRKFLITFLLIFSMCVGGTWAYQYKGYNTYSEALEGSKFQCSKECSILLGSTQFIDKVSIKGTFEGQGTVGIVFASEKGAINGPTLNINNVTQTDNTIVFANVPGFHEIQDKAQVIFTTNGNVRGQVQFQLQQTSFKENIKQGRSDFWKKEDIRGFSINLNEGSRINGKNIVRYGYIVLMLTALVLFFIPQARKKYSKSLLIATIIIFGLIGSRDYINKFYNTQRSYQEFTRQDRNNNQFLDLGEYIGFTKKIQDTIDYKNATAQNCKIYIQTPYPRPFKVHRKLVYLNPCDIVEEKDKANYLLYFHQAPELDDQGKPILLQYKMNLLLQNK